MTKENFQVDLRGIVEILSHHLYSSPRVYVRELIQNARDAVVARLKVDPDLPARLGSKAPIALTVNETTREVVIRDHGIGLTETDARNLLATIGASSKKQEFAAARRDYLGQFGIGLLSCFLVADQIEVRSRSATDPSSPTMRWVGYGDGTYTVTAAEDALDEPGTEIRVLARPDEREWVGGGRVQLLARQFARLLSIPITVGQIGGHGTTATENTAEDAQPILISMETPPWLRNAETAANWCEDEYGFHPLATIPINVPAFGVRGIAFITRSESRSRGGDLVYSHGMFVASDNTQLVPDWGTFARVSLEAGELGLTASREGLQDSTSLEQVREEVGRQIRAGIEGMSSQRPDAFTEFLNIHGVSLLAMAADDEQMLDFVARHYQWETSSGDMCLTEMPNRVTYADSIGDFNTYAPLIAARGGLLINGGYSNGLRTIRAFDRAQTRVKLNRFDLTSMLEDLPIPQEESRGLADYLRRAAEPVLDRLGTAVEIRDFKPDSLMVLHIPATHSRYDFDFDVEEDNEDPWADLLGSTNAHLERGGRRKQEVDHRPKLVLNLRSAAVRAIGKHLDPNTRVDAIRALHLLSLLQAGLRLTADDQAALAGALQTLLLAASGSYTDTAPRKN